MALPLASMDNRGDVQEAITGTRRRDGRTTITGVIMPMGITMPVVVVEVAVLQCVGEMTTLGIDIMRMRDRKRHPRTGRHLQSTLGPGLDLLPERGPSTPIRREGQAAAVVTGVVRRMIDMIHDEVETGLETITMTGIGIVPSIEGVIEKTDTD